MERVPTRVIAMWVLVAAVHAGCSSFGQPVDGGTGSYGFGRPTLEVTIGGAQFGPEAPAAGSGIYLTSSRDPAGQEIDATVRISAQTASGVSCQMAFQRFGQSLAPFHAGAAYQISGDATGDTPDGVVVPQGNQLMNTPQGSVQCAGSTCDGGALLLTVLQADHIEGTVTGTFQDPGGAGSAASTCSFYLPTLAFQP
jgi:hypothetical protein